MTEIVYASALGIVFVASLWGLIVNQATSRRVQKEIDEVFRLRVSAINRGSDPNAISYPANNAYNCVLWRLFFFRKVDDLLPYSHGIFPIREDAV